MSRNILANPIVIQMSHNMIEACIGRMQGAFQYLQNADENALSFWKGKGATQFAEVSTDNAGIARAMIAELEAINKDLWEACVVVQERDRQLSQRDHASQDAAAMRWG